MAVFPPDDMTLAAATRRRLKPMVDSHGSGFVENVRRNPAFEGKSQARDLWGRLKWTASLEFRLAIADIELMMSFWEVYRVSGFTAFDFEQIQIGSPGYRPADALGTGDGATTVFTIRAKEVVAGTQIVYNNTVVVAGTTLGVGTGSQGEDQITFAAAPPGAKTVTAATNATPIAVTTSAAHGRATGEIVTISGVLGNLAANGTFTITVTGANTFTLNGSVGTGAYTSGGTVAASALTIAYLGRRRYTCEIPAPPSKGNIEWNRQRIGMTLLEKF